MNRKSSPWLLLLGPYPPPVGGVASYLQALFRHLPADQCVWYGYGERPFIDEDIHVVRPLEFDPAWCLWKLFRPRVVLDSSTVFLEYFDSRLFKRWLPLILFRRVRWVKVVHDTNLPRLFEAFDSRTQRSIRFASRFVWRYVAVNEELARWLSETLVPARKVRVIPSLIEGPADSAEKLIDPKLRELREDSDHLVCAVGAMNPDYGFQDVVAAVRQLQVQTQEKVGLVLLCTGFAGQSRFREQLRDQCPEMLVLEDHPRQQALAVMRASDVLVRAVRSESYGLSRVEAVFQGTPVVATSTGETRGMYVYRFGDVDRLVSQIKAALTEEARDATTEYAKRYAEEAAANRRELLQLLDRAAGRA